MVKVTHVVGAVIAVELSGHAFHVNCRPYAVLCRSDLASSVRVLFFFLFFVCFDLAVVFKVTAMRMQAQQNYPQSTTSLLNRFSF